MRAMIQKLVQSTLSSSLGDLPVSLTLTSTTAGKYDPKTGQSNKTIVEVTVKAVLVGVNEKDSNDLELLTKGKKALVAAADIPGIRLDAMDDTATVDGQLYKIKSHKIDPAGALYSLMLLAVSPKTNGL